MPALILLGSMLGRGYESRPSLILRRMIILEWLYGKAKRRKNNRRLPTVMNRQLHTLSSFPAPANDDTTMILADNLRLDPNILIGNGNGIFGSGVQGSGKT